MTEVTANHFELVHVRKKGCRRLRIAPVATRPASRVTGKSATALHVVTLWNIVPPTEELFLALDQTAVERFWPTPTLMPVMVDSGRYSTKPTNEDTRQISSRIMSRSQRVTHTGLAELVTAGHTVIPAALDRGIDPSTGKPYGTPRAAVLREKRLWMFDIDSKQEGLTVTSVLRNLLDFGIQPFLIYETLSSTDAIPRYRICFQSSEAVTDPTLQLRISLGLIQALTGTLPDMDASCVNHYRLFYPARRITWMASRSVTGIERLFELVAEEELVQQPVISAAPSRPLVPAIQPWNPVSPVSEGVASSRYSTPEVEAIKVGDAERLRSLVLEKTRGFDGTLNPGTLYLEFNIHSKPPVIPVAMADRIPYLCSIPLGLILGVPGDGSFFRCPLHDDMNPSCHIIQVDKGTYVQYKFKCFGKCVSTMALSVLDVAEELQLAGTYKAFKFLCDVFNIGDTEWMAAKKQELDMYAEYISGPPLREGFPVLHADLHRSNTIPLLLHDLNDARRHIVDRTMPVDTSWIERGKVAKI